MAKKAKKAAKKGVGGARKSARTAAKTTPMKAAKKGARKAGRNPAGGSAKTASAKSSKTAKSAKAGARKAAAAGGVRKSPAVEPPRKPSRNASAASRRPNLDRDRRTVHEPEDVHSVPSSLNMDRTASAVRTGREELEERLREHTSTGPAMTGGDVDADWEDAETVGDQAPGGDNPTPDQDIVDEIGRAVGIEYDDDEELQGGDEIVERDRHRWELDPRSKEDFEDE